MCILTHININQHILSYCKINKCMVINRWWASNVFS